MDKGGSTNIIKTLVQELKKPLMFFFKEDMTTMMSAVLIKYAEEAKVMSMQTDNLIF